MMILSIKRGDSVNTFCERLVYLKEKNKLHWQDIAMAVGISKASLSHYMSGRSAVPSADILFKIAKFFMVNPEWLAGGNVPMSIISLNDDSVFLIERYSSLSAVGKQQLLEFSLELSNREKEEK